MLLARAATTLLRLRPCAARGAALPCIDLDAELVGGARLGGSAARAAATDLGVTPWNYQACTELLLEPITSDGAGFYPEADGGQTGEVVSSCERLFDVAPRPAHMPRAFGVGADWSRCTNVFFSENAKDPWHVGTSSLPPAGGVDGSVVRLVAEGGAHHQDLRFSSELDAPDVHRARAAARTHMTRWLAAARGA